ncbi:MAG: T9SS type A sorting domain-containing protein, partial [Cyclobacteriaceae bacterium]
GGIYSGVTTNALLLTDATTANNAYKYKCIVTGTCSTTSAVADLFVQTVPILTGQPADATVCAGGNTSFTVTTSTGTGGFQWQMDNGSGYVNYGLFSGTGTLNVIGAPASMNGYKFRCIVGLCTPSVISGEATLTVTGAIITSQPTYAPVCESGNASFTVVASGSGLSYQWQKNNVNLSNGGIFSGVTTPTLTLTGVTVADNATHYRCIVTGIDICPTSTIQAILYVYLSPNITTQPISTTKCVGSTATYTVAITPQSGVTYQWEEKVPSGSFEHIANGGIYSGATGTTLALTGVTAAMDGNKYRCVVGTCATPVISFDADLVIDLPPVVTVQPLPSTICAGMNTTFTADGTGLGLTFQWQSQPSGTGSYANIVNGGIYSGATTGTLTLTNVQLSETLTRYRCVLTASGVCTAVNTTNVPIIVRPIPTFNTQPVDQAKCEGVNVNLNSNPSNAFSAHQWQIDTGSGFVDMVNTTEYPNVFSQNLSFIAQPSQNGNKYRLKVGSCTPSVFSNEATVTVYAKPTITNEPVAATICEGGDATFEVTATGSSLVYQWRRGGATIANGNLYSGVTTSKLTITGFTGSSAEFTCTITGESGCAIVTTSPVMLTVGQIQITDHPTAVVAFCDGGNATFSVTATGQTLAYQWWEMNNGVLTELVDGGVYAGVTTSTLTLTNVPFSMNSRLYRCVVSGCGVDQVSSFAGLPVNQIPTKPVITASLSNPESPTLSASGGSTYQWFKNGTAISGANSQQYSVTSEGSYTVQSTVNSCLSPISDPHVIIITGDLEDISSTDVQVYPNPVVDRLTISFSNFNISMPVSVSITDMLGRSMEQSSVIGKKSIDIDVTPYRQGQYMVRLQQANRSIVTQFIKSNR